MRIFLTFSIIFYCLNADSQVKKIQAETIVKNVTIFSSGATVERNASVAITPGRSEITFSGLSNQLDQQSIQLNANADITLLSVQTTKDFLTERKIDNEEKRFIERLQSLKDTLGLDKKLMEVYKNEETMLIKNEAIGGTEGVKTSELKDALNLHRQRLTDIYKKELEIQKRITDEEKNLSGFNAQLEQISKKRDSINYIVTALIESKETKNVNFTLRYNVKDAGWYPSYDVRVADVTKPLSVLMNANVFQRSGETWKDISLILSTGNPNDNATPSKLQPWKLGFYDPNIAFRGQGIEGFATGRVTDENGEPIVGATIIIKGTKNGTATDKNGFFKLENFPSNSIISVTSVGFEKKEVALQTGYFTIILTPSTQALQEVVVVGYGTTKRNNLSDEEYREIKNKKETIKTVSVATQYQPTTTVYKIENKYNLETDGKTTTIGIKQFDVPALYNYFTIPKIDPVAYLNAKIVDWQNYDLQSGEASLYYEGSYLGKTYIDLSTAGDTLSISLGKDEGIKISRKVVKEFSSKHLIGSNKTETRTYQITLRNTKRVAVNLNVSGQVPISITKEISIDDINAPGSKIDEDTGIVTWNFTLVPGEEKKLEISYSIKYPKDKKVVLE